MVNLNSTSETTVADIQFKPAHSHKFPIIVFKCRDVLGASNAIRTWLEESIDEDDHDTLRMDDQALDMVPPRQQGQLVLLEDAAALGGWAEHPTSIFAIFIPKDDRIRWFWCLFSPSSLLIELTGQNLIGPPTAVSATSPKHGALYTFLITGFTTATTYPNSPDFIAASKLLDLCPPIRDPDTAHRRIEADVYLWFNGKTGADISDDRYILHLEPAERELVSLLDMGCARYILYKKTFFKQLGYEVIHDSEKVKLHQLRQQQDLEGQEGKQAVDTPVATPAPSAGGVGSVDGDK